MSQELKVKEGELAASQAEIDRLKADNATLRGIITETTGKQADGIDDDIAEDVKRRMALGLPKHHAIESAISQKENDARIAREEAVEAEKVAKRDKLEAQKRSQLRDEEVAHVKAATEKIAELEAKLAAK